MLICRLYNDAGNIPSWMNTFAKKVKHCLACACWFIGMITQRYLGHKGGYLMLLF